MIYTPAEYAEAFALNKKKVSERSVRRRCEKGSLPSNHKPVKSSGGHWVIVVMSNNGQEHK